jgi:hypothetical protein
MRCKHRLAVRLENGEYENVIFAFVAKRDAGRGWPERVAWLSGKSCTDKSNFRWNNGKEGRAKACSAAID